MKIEILLAHNLKISHKKIQDLRQVFSSLDEAWQADFVALKKTGWDDNFIHEFLNWREKIDAQKIEETLQKEGIHCITQSDDEYPKLLKEIYDPPLCLFVRGNLTGNENFLAVVGPRKFSAYGKQVTETLIPSLSQAGLTIVSGLALGVDGIAHSVTLQANGKTIAVLGGGIDNKSIQPTAHRKLAEGIIEKGGAVISEYPPYTFPTNYTFPKRNRIIAGMSLGTLVIEAGESSGSLITAQCALDSNREVFAVPQNIFSPTSIGTNSLIKMGAKVVMNYTDILEAYQVDTKTASTKQEKKKITADNPTEESILNAIKLEPTPIDFIIKNSGLASQIVNSTLTMMEIKGKVKNMGGMKYVVS